MIHFIFFTVFFSMSDSWFCLCASCFTSYTCGINQHIPRNDVNTSVCNEVRSTKLVVFCALFSPAMPPMPPFSKQTKICYSAASHRDVVRTALSLSYVLTFFLVVFLRRIRLGRTASTTGRQNNADDEAVQG